MQKNIKLVLGFIALLGVGLGCAVGPKYQGPKNPELHTFTASVENTTAEAVETQWWRTLRDPLLNAYVDEALANNIQLKIATEQIKMAEAFRKMAAARKVPNIGVGAGYSAGMFSNQGPLAGPMIGTGMMDRHMDAMGAGATLSWEPDLFGAIANQEKAEIAKRSQAEYLRGGVQVLVVSAVVENYMQLRCAQQRKAVVEETVAAQESMHENLMTLSRSGLASDLHLSRVTTQLEATRSLVPMFDSAIHAHANRLAILLGKQPSVLQSELLQARPLPSVTGAIPIGLPSDVLLRRPDIAIAEQGMRAANAQQGAAKASKYPRIYLTGTPGILAGNFDDVFSSGSSFWLAGVGFQWNLFDGGFRNAMEEAADANFVMAELHYEETWLTALGEVETMLTGYGNSQKREKRLELALNEAEASYKKIQVQYDAGLIDLNTVLVAQQQRNAVKDQLLTGKAATIASVIGLYKSLGGGWDRPEPKPDPKKK